MFRSIIAPVRLQAMINLARTAPVGAFAEVGVFKGGSAWELYKVALLQGRELHLFDTFRGTPVFTEKLDKHRIDGEFDAEGWDYKIREQMPLAQVHVGVYPQTHPKDLSNVAFVHCDCDQYLSYKAVIGNLWPLVVEGGFMLFDDYPYLEGAKQAVEEHFRHEDLLKCGQQFYVKKGENENSVQS